MMNSTNVSQQKLSQDWSQLFLTHQAIESAIATLNNCEGFSQKKLTKIGHKFDEVATILIQASNQLGLELTPHQHWQLLSYLDTLLLWNKTYNLTAITDPVEAMVKHVVDCLAIIPCLLDKTLNLSDTEMLDIGTGAGLPAVIVAICQPERICTPLDSNQKKIRFIKQVCAELKLTNVSPVATRIQKHEGLYQLITSRAFASLEDFIELATPYLATGGKLIAMKGKVPTEEIEKFSKEWNISSIPLDVPFLEDSRHIIYLEKRSVS